MYGWLFNCVTIAESNEYSEVAFISVLLHTSTFDAKQYVGANRKLEKSAAEHVQDLERKYGVTMTPVQAMVQVSTMTRKPGQPLLSFNNEVRTISRMANRNMANRAEAARQVEAAVLQHMLRSLSPAIREQVSSTMSQFVINNHHPMTTDEVEALARQLESNREEHKRNVLAKQAKHVRAAILAEIAELPDDADVLDEDDFLVNAVMEKKTRAFRRGKQVSPANAAKSAIKKIGKGDELPIDPSLQEVAVGPQGSGGT